MTPSSRIPDPIDAARAVAAGLDPAHPPAEGTREHTALQILAAAGEPPNVIGRYAGEDEPLPDGYAEGRTRDTGQRVFLLIYNIPGGASLAAVARSMTAVVYLEDGGRIGDHNAHRYRVHLNGVADAAGNPPLIDTGEIDPDTAKIIAELEAGRAGALAGRPGWAVAAPGTPAFDELLGTDPDGAIANAAVTMAEVMGIGLTDGPEPLLAALERLGVRTASDAPAVLAARRQRENTGTVTISAAEYSALVAAAGERDAVSEKYEAMLAAACAKDPVTVIATGDPAAGVELRRAWLEELLDQASAVERGQMCGPFLAEVLEHLEQARAEAAAATHALTLVSDNTVDLRKMLPAQWWQHPGIVDLADSLARARLAADTAVAEAGQWQSATSRTREALEVVSRERDAGYTDAAMLMALVCSILDGCWALDADPGAPGYGVAAVELPAGQYTKHIHPRDLPHFQNIRPSEVPNPWKGGSKAEEVAHLAASIDFYRSPAARRAGPTANAG